MHSKRIPLVAVACLIWGVLSLAACGSGGTGSGGTPTPAASAATILANAQQAKPKAAAYIADIQTVANGATTELKETISYILQPARAHEIIATTSGGTNSTIETFTDGTTSYIMLGGQWMKAGTAPDVATLDIGKTTLASVAGASSSFTLVGTETLNGVATYHLTASPPAATSAQGKADVWVRQDNYYLVKLTAQEASTTGAQQGQATISITYSAWDDGVKIDLPPGVG